MALKLAKTPEFQAYQAQVVKNSKALAKALQQHGHKLSTGNVVLQRGNSVTNTLIRRRY